MKKYKTCEMIKMFSENRDLRFKGKNFMGKTRKYG